MISAIGQVKGDLCVDIKLHDIILEMESKEKRIFSRTLDHFIKGRFEK